MKTLKKNQGLILTILVLIAGFMLYRSFFGTYVADVETSNTARSIGGDLLDTLDQLQGVTLDSELFSLSGYILLNDFSTEVPAQPTGRSNPFDLIGRD